MLRISRDIANATRISKRLPPSLAAKTVALLSETDLSTWRDNLGDGGMPSATVVRISQRVQSGAESGCARDPRITNAAAWRHGLSGISENYESRNILRLDDDKVRAVTEAAYAIDYAFGLLVRLR